jgi:hypothetical protein
VSHNGKVEFVHPYSKGTTRYMIGSISIPCRYRGIEGRYSLSLIEDDDYAVFSGREKIGFFKKMGKIHLARDGRRIEAWVERRGVRLLEITAELVEDLPQLPPQSERLAPLTGVLTEDSQYRWRGFMFKWVLAHAGGFDFGPVMSRQAGIGGPGFSRDGVSQQAKILEIKTHHSPFDRAWAELRMVKKPTEAGYSRGGAFTMLSSEVVEEVEVDAEAFEPYTWYKYDY